MSSVCSIDPTSVKSLGDLQQTFYKNNISILLSACVLPVLEAFETCADLHEFSDNHFFPTTKDAIVYVSL